MESLEALSQIASNFARKLCRLLKDRCSKFAHSRYLSSDKLLFCFRYSSRTLLASFSTANEERFLSYPSLKEVLKVLPMERVIASNTIFMT